METHISQKTKDKEADRYLGGDWSFSNGGFQGKALDGSGSELARTFPEPCAGFEWRQRPLPSHSPTQH